MKVTLQPPVGEWPAANQEAPLMKRLCLALASLLAMGTGPAAAKELVPAEPRPRAISVAYADLDLSSQDDAAVLLGRLRLAAARACEVREVRQPGPTLRRAIAACRDAAMSEAVAGIDAPELTRLHAVNRH
jgi:UrcA family protein